MGFLAFYAFLLLAPSCFAAPSVSLAEFLKQPATQGQLDSLTHSSETLNKVVVIHPSAASLILRRQLIEEAKSFTFITTPFWFNDKSGASLASSLINKSNQDEGFEYRILQDWISPLYSKRAHEIYKLLKPHITLWNSPTWQRRFSYNFLNAHVHDKYFIVDGTKMIIGSANINDEHLQGGDTETGWHDTDLYVEGPAAQMATANYIKIWQLARYLASAQAFPPFRDQEIEILQKYFYENQEDYEFTTVKANYKGRGSPLDVHHIHLDLKKYLSDPRYFPKLVADGAYVTPLRVVYDNPLINRDLKTKKEFSNIRRALTFLLEHAHQSAWFYIPYLTLDHEFEDLLISQAGRLDINIITNSAETYDVSKKAYRGQLSHYDRLVGSGIKIFEWQGHGAILKRKAFGLQKGHWPGHTLHSKMALIDDAVVAIGSENFNLQSFKHNSEELSIINDPAVALSVKNIFSQDLHSELQGLNVPIVKYLSLSDIEELKAKFKVTHPLWSYPAGD